VEHNYFHQDPISKTETIAKSGPFQIEIMKYVAQMIMQSL